MTAHLLHYWSAFVCLHIADQINIITTWPEKKIESEGGNETMAVKLWDLISGECEADDENVT